MSHRSRHGGRHELGQNFLVHRPTIDRIVTLVASTAGPILEIGAGDGALTRPLTGLGRSVTAIEIDEHRVRMLRRRVPRATVVQGDAVTELTALTRSLDRPVVVGNLPYHLTTPILRRLLTERRWQHAVLLTQWEVARKRAGVGGSTMLTAQTTPWFVFELHGRVPAHGFRPVPSVDGGLLSITRRGSPLVDPAHRRRYEAFVRALFTGRGRGLESIVATWTGWSRSTARRALDRARIRSGSLPRDLDPHQWAQLWEVVGTRPDKVGEPGRSRIRVDGGTTVERRRRCRPNDQ
ncbi:23S ribosomal RNA methyltransferase Erm [Saccharomonospora azurea]|uniref:23S ribosomal RNA methyltransferase Erm n=1 Tax=Saccharomonospora azurea TaxID=40988 RepID=UPI00023FF075|nr:23S ribosomal RNA methyltransferase Erm [Saccharomonospora azurea]EHK88395.1 rRNA (adenine-N(6)-)-methyltransferase [Saccharomonospora azurea SZMC 14600]